MLSPDLQDAVDVLKEYETGITIKPIFDGNPDPRGYEIRVLSIHSPNDVKPKKVEAAFNYLLQHVSQTGAKVELMKDDLNQRYGIVGYIIGDKDGKPLPKTADGKTDHTANAIGKLATFLADHDVNYPGSANYKTPKKAQG